MTNWKEYTLGNVIKVKHGFAFKGEFFSQSPTSDVLLTPGNINIGGGFKADKFKYYKGAYPDSYVLKEGDVIVTMTDLSKEGDTLGYSAKIPKHNDVKYLHNQRLGLIQLIDNELNPDFIYWLLRTKDYQQFIVSSATGTTVKHTSPTRIGEYVFRAPDYNTQTAIAEILSALDDKIELNNQINQELESLVQTLFKQWFIDFEFPNQNGEPYKSSGGEMVGSELGEIPKGWAVERLGDHLYIKGRIGWKGLKKSEYLQEFVGYSIVNGSDFLNEQIDYATCGWIPKERYDDSPEIQLKKNDILITKDGTIGKLAFVNLLKCPTSVASGVFVVRPNSDKVSTFFCWSFFKSHYFQNLVKSRIDGSVIPHLYQKDFVEMFIPLPPKNLLEDFEIQASSIFEIIFNNKEESQELSKLRNTLLPKLISGELNL